MTLGRRPFASFRRRIGVSAKLYWLAGLSALAVAILAVASLHFSRLTEDAATQLKEKGFVAVESSARLQSLLAQHRQIVESAPAEVVRSRLDKIQREFIARSSQLSLLVNQLNRGQHSDEGADALQGQIRDELPKLVTAGEDVMFYAYN